MLSVDQALLLGVVQGLTEFLPISSSGHLVILQSFFGLTTPPIAFDSLIHIGTLAAVFVYFRRQIPLLFRTKFLHLVLGTLPSVIFGLYVYFFALNTFTDTLQLGLGFLVTAFILLLTHLTTRPGQPLQKLSYFQALVVGLFQALSILPSISRSGATIAGGRFSNLSKEAAFSFSFILSIPAIIGALVLTGRELLNPTAYPTLPSFVGLIGAFISGLFGLKLLDLMFKRYSLTPFIVYTAVLGILILGLTN